MHTADDGPEVRVPVTAGAHDVGVSFVRRHWEPEGVLQPPQRGFARTTNELYLRQSRGGHRHDRRPVLARSRRRTSPSRRSGVRLPSGDGDVCRGARARDDPVDARASRLSPSGDRRRISTRCSTFYRAGSAEGGFEAGIQRGARRILASPSFLFRIEREPANSRLARSYRAQRPRPGVAAVVLPLEQHSGRRAARRGGARHAERRRPCSSSRCAGCSPIRRSQALVDNFASQWLTLGKLAGVVPDVDAYPEFDENLRDAFRQETRLFVGSQLREDRSVARAADRRLHVRERAAGAALPDPERLRQPLPARDVRRRQARRTARSGQHPDGDVVSEPHVAGAARPMAARQRARRAAAAAAARRAGAQGERRRRRSRGRSASRWKRTARTRRARRATCGWIRSGSRSRTSTRSASGAPSSDGIAGRCVGVASRRHDVRGRRRPAPAAGRAIRKTSCARSRRSCWPTRSGAASNRPTCRRSGRSPRRGAGGLPLVVAHLGIVTSTPFTMSTTRGAAIGRRSRPPAAP